VSIESLYLIQPSDQCAGFSRQRGKSAFEYDINLADLAVLCEKESSLGVSVWLLNCGWHTHPIKLKLSVAAIDRIHHHHH
jgi:hypothetical protein